MAEINHSEFSNFFNRAAFKYVESNGQREIEKARPPGSKRASGTSKTLGPKPGVHKMRYAKYLALLTVLMVPLAYSQAQVGVAVGVGGVGVAVGPGYAAGPPVCEYGYYDYYPYACAPYGFYGPNYFVNGFFIGAGPWYHWG